MSHFDYRNSFVETVRLNVYVSFDCLQILMYPKPKKENWIHNHDINDQ